MGFYIFIAISSFDSNNAKSVELRLNLSFEENIPFLEARRIFYRMEIVYLEVFGSILAFNHLLKKSISVFKKDCRCSPKRKWNYLEDLGLAGHAFWVPAKGPPRLPAVSCLLLESSRLFRARPLSDRVLYLSYWTRRFPTASPMEVPIKDNLSKLLLSWFYGWHLNGHVFGKERGLFQTCSRISQ